MDRPQDPARARVAAVAAAWPAGALALAALFLAVLSDGFLWQDEYAHLSFSRWFLRHPEVAVDLWGRPLATLAYAPVAALGMTAARLVTVALGALAAWLTGRAAAARGLPPMVAAAAVVAQPFLFRFAFGALPGVLFAAVLAWFLHEEERGRPGRAAVAAALLPLARVEGVLVVAAYALALLRRGERRLALVPFAGLAVWNVGGWIVTGSPLFLLDANPYPVTGSIYPTGGYHFILRALPAAAGGVVFLLAQAGVWSRLRAPRVEHAIGAVVAVFLVLVWGVPMFASTPTPVYLIGFAPLLALYAADGWRWLRARPRARVALGVLALAEAFLSVPRLSLAPTDALFAPVGGVERWGLVAGFAVAALALVAGVRSWRLTAAGLAIAAAANVAPAARPVPRDAHQRAADLAAAAFVALPGDSRAVAVAPDFMWFAEADPFVGWEPGVLPDDVAGLRRLPSDAIVAWDSEYSAREGAIGLESLLRDGWEQLGAFEARGVLFVLLGRGAALGR